MSGDDQRRRPVVLVADDEDQIRELMAILLRGADYDVLTAADGDEALELALSRRPDVALLDIAMPGRSGIEVMEELRRSRDGRSVHVVFVSAQEPDATTHGCQRFVKKPFRTRHLVQAIEACLDGEPAASA